MLQFLHAHVHASISFPTYGRCAHSLSSSSLPSFEKSSCMCWCWYRCCMRCVLVRVLCAGACAVCWCVCIFGRDMHEPSSHPNHTIDTHGMHTAAAARTGCNTPRQATATDTACTRTARETKCECVDVHTKNIHGQPETEWLQRASNGSDRHSDLIR